MPDEMEIAVFYYSRYQTNLSILLSAFSPFIQDDPMETALVGEGVAMGVGCRRRCLREK